MYLLVEYIMKLNGEREMTKDIRKEQLELLRFEKKLAGLAATLAAGAVVAKTADEKLNSSVSADAYADIQSALVHLAEVTSKAHATVNEQALQVGMRLINPEAGPLPKSDPVNVVASILGLG